MADTPGGDRSNLFAALKGLLAALAEIGRKRLELLANEVEEEKLRLIDLLVSAAGAVFLLSFGIVLLVVFLAVAFWEQRVVVLGISSGMALLIGALFALHLRSRLKQPPTLFRASIKELGKDIEALRGKPEARP